MAELLKISELAARAGVEKSTVQYYLREGLLPPPAAKPHRNMAYYSSDTVERIKLIRELQSRRFLPLSQIKKLLEDHEGIDALRLFVSEEPKFVSTDDVEGGQRTRTQILEETVLTPEVLDKLADAGFVRPTEGENDEELVYAPVDTAILRALSLMSTAGLNAENGFHVEDMTFYLEATRSLIGKEVALFTGVMGRLPRSTVLEMARAGLRGSNLLLVALRRKVLLQLLGEIASEESSP